MNVEHFLGVLRQCFTDAEISPALARDTIILAKEGDEYVDVGNVAEQEKLLSEIVRDLTSAWTKYFQLHVSVEKELQRQFHTNNQDRSRRDPWTVLELGDDPEGEFVNLSRILSSTLFSLTGRHSYGPGDPDVTTQRLPSAVGAARTRARELTPMTDQANGDYKTWQKVALVEAAIWCWQQVDQRKPKYTNPRFQDLVQGLADALDPGNQRGWSADRLIRTYKEKIKKLAPSYNK